MTSWWRAPGRRPSTRFPVLLGLMLALFTVWSVPPAVAADPDHVSFTLEGCRQPLPAGYDLAANNFICPDANYTTGNLQSGWAELDLVPHRLTAQAGNSAPNSQTYIVDIVADRTNSGVFGYDHIALVTLNTSKSAASCALSVGGELVATPGVGGTDTSVYRKLTITQNKNTTCVIDWVERLALGSAAFPGSSLHSNATLENLSTGGIGARDVSIPVKGILPQELSKTMTASQPVDFVWNITKSATPARVTFEDTCDPTKPRTQPVTVHVEWQRLEGTPGAVTVVTNISATNPTSRTITVHVCDDIRSGTTVLDTKCTSPDIDLPANTTQVVLTHTYPAAAEVTDLNDIATATYTDKVTGLPVPGNTTATASANIQTGTQSNATATIEDVESITGSGLSYSTDSFIGASGTFQNGYGAGTDTTGDVTWDSDTQTGASSLDFTKTVRVTAATSTSGSLDDTATLNASGGFTTNASASVAISSNATVKLTINKTIPDILQNSETATFKFEVRGPSPTTTLVASPSITFSAGETSKSVTVSGLTPGSYEVTELSTPGFETSSTNPQTVDIDLPICESSVTFDNVLAEASLARVEVKKVTDPAGYEAGWTFHLSGQASAQVTTTDASFIELAHDLAEGSYNVGEDLLSNWVFVQSSCTRTDASGTTTVGTKSFQVNYPADFGVVYRCTFTNKSRGTARVVKTVRGAAPSASQSFTFQLRQGSSTSQAGTILETLTANSGNGGVINFATQLVPGTTYALCEQVMPGWLTTLGPPFYVVYNPSGDNSTVCTDFTVGLGATKTFNIDNTPPPGGLARTIGFWKNWASCAGSKGNQKPVLDQTLQLGDITTGILVLHDSNPDPNVASDCLAAVRLLSKSTIDTGKSMSSDPAFNLAAQLLAAKLNVQAGAGTCPAAVTAINNAQALLAAIHFNGIKHDKMTAAQTTQSNSLATTLDKYNNDTLCSP